jgi:hypothetical protein
MSGRPEDGYRTDSRIVVRTDRRGRLAALLAGGALVLGAIGAIGGPRPAPRVTPPPGSAATAVRSGLPTGTVPPWLDVRDGAPAGVVPLVATLLDVPPPLVATGVRGLEWLDPRHALATVGPATDLAQWAYLRGDGSTVCVCLQLGE